MWAAENRRNFLTCYTARYTPPVFTGRVGNEKILHDNAISARPENSGRLYTGFHGPWRRVTCIELYVHVGGCISCRLLIGEDCGCCQRQGWCHSLSMPVADHTTTGAPACNFVFHTLHSTRCRTGSQCNPRCTCVIWSYLLAPLTSRATAFWNGLKLLHEAVTHTPCNSELQSSRQETTAWSSVFAASVFSERSQCRSWKYLDRQSAATCSGVTIRWCHPLR